MKSVIFDHLTQPAAVQTETRLLDALLARQVDVMMACGGRGICATCHVHVLRGQDCLTPRTQRENKTLARLSGVKGQSRLSCQARVIGDGVRVRLPNGLFVRSVDDLGRLVGRRAQAPVLHPADGRVLIQRGKLITRSAVGALKQIDFTIRDIDFV